MKCLFPLKRKLNSNLVILCGLTSHKKNLCFTQHDRLCLSFKCQEAYSDPTQSVCKMTVVFRDLGEKKTFMQVGFKSIYLMLAQLDLLGSVKTGASSLDRLVTIPWIIFSRRVKISLLEIKRQSGEDDNASKVSKSEQKNTKTKKVFFSFIWFI